MNQRQSVGNARAELTSLATYISPELVEELTHRDWRVRSNAIGQLHANIVHLDDTRQLQNLPSLIKLLIQLLNDSNFKISLTAIQILEILIEKARFYIRTSLPLLLSGLVDKFGDSKIAIRHGAKDLVNRLSDVLSPGPVIDGICNIVTNIPTDFKTISTIREEVVTVIIRSLLVFSDYNFVLDKIVKILLGCLSDTKQKVKYTAIEALAVINAKSPSKLSSIFSMQIIDQDTFRSLQQRFADGKIAYINEEGMVQFRPLTTRTSSILGDDQPPKILARAQSINTDNLDPNLNNSSDNIRSLPIGNRSVSATLPGQVSLRSVSNPTTNNNNNNNVITTTNINNGNGNNNLILPPPSNSSVIARSPSKELVSSSYPSSEPSIYYSTSEEYQQQQQQQQPQLQHQNYYHSPNNGRDYPPSRLSNLEYAPSLGIARRRTNSVLSVQRGNNQLVVSDLENSDERNLTEPSSDSPSKDRLSSLKNRPKQRSISSAMRNAAIEDDDTMSVTSETSVMSSPKLTHLKRRRPQFSARPSNGSPSSSPSQSNHYSNQQDVTYNDISCRSSIEDLLSANSTSSHTSSSNEDLAHPGIAPAHTSRTEDYSPTDTPESTLLLREQPSLPHLSNPHPSPPSRNPERELKNAIENMKSSEWDKNSEAIDSIKRIAQEHPEVLAPQMHSILQLVLNLVESLRSGLAKNAIICTGDLFALLPKQMECEIDFVLPRILKKYCEASAFLVKETDRALQSIFENASKNKMLTSLLACSKHKHVNIRSKCSHYVASCLDELSGRDFGVRDIEKVLPTIFQFTQEANAETRANGKKALFAVFKIVNNPKEFEAIVKKFMSESQANRIIEMVGSIGNSIDPYSFKSVKPTNGSGSSPYSLRGKK